MAALQPSVGGLPSQQGFSGRSSFADVLLSKPMSSTPSDPVVHANPTDPTLHANPTPPVQPILGLHKGLPSIEFADPLVHDLSKPYGWSLIGKFAQGYNKSDPKLGRPSVENIQKYLVAMDFKGEFTVGLMDNRHAWIHFSCEEDYLRLYSRQVWYIGGIAMRIFKWTPYFQVDIESSLVPVWIKFPRLPIQFFQKAALFPIASLLGLPLRLDSATTLLKRPSVARIQVEIDLMKPRPDSIWIQLGSKGGYWQKVEYENVPAYCTHCWHVGHSVQVCHVQNPALKSQAVPPRVDALQWLPKQRPAKAVATVSVSDSLPVSEHSQQRPDPAVATVPISASLPTVSEHFQQRPGKEIATPVSASAAVMVPIPTVPASVATTTTVVSSGFFSQPLPALVTHEIGFVPDLVEIESVHSDGDHLSASPRLVTIPSFDFSRDDLSLPNPPPCHPTKPFASEQKPSQAMHIASRATFTQDLRVFSSGLQIPPLIDTSDYQLPLVLPTARKRGRPRGSVTAYPRPQHPPHHMITRSSHSNPPGFND